MSRPLHNPPEEPLNQPRRSLRLRRLENPDLNEAPPVQPLRERNQPDEMFVLLGRLDRIVDDIQNRARQQAPEQRQPEQQGQQYRRERFERARAARLAAARAQIAALDAHRRQLEALMQQFLMRRNDDSDSGEEADTFHLAYGSAHADCLPMYIKRALRNRKNDYRCSLCNRNTRNGNFLNHVNTCDGKKKASFEEQEKAVCLFKSSDFFVNQELCRLREQLEIQYFEATINPACREQMACETCKSVSDHREGKCMDEFQIITFLKQAKLIVHKALGEYANFVDYENISTLAPTSVEQTDEPEGTAVLPADQSENWEQNYKLTHDKFMKLVEKHSKRMLAYIQTNRGNKSLKTIVEYRKKNNMNVLTEERDADFNKLSTASRPTPSSRIVENVGRFFPY